MKAADPVPPDNRGRQPFVVAALDRVTDASLWLAMAALAAIFFAYNIEVVLRYLFDSPTRWSAEFVSYFLLVATFAALPKLTRDGGHVAVTVLLERLSSRLQHTASIGISLLGAFICCALAWIAAEETLRQIERDVRMMAAIPVPKAAVSCWMVWGLALAALQFLRLGVSRARKPVLDTASC
ncbi:MAG: TRAP transporter small permease [Rhodobacteraceae bacterium]|jgi:TRAP-type C4-dicarboxylate transport system permease small subunit|uniref:TRAP transporter small permease n=1 Tax=Marivita sp. TaxID=2003365 RepID=UPI003B518BB4|nr:TRAP transporter small permease [Paracoccaceae bacterium]